MPNIQWISHRGHCFDGIENTLDAFRDAENRGFTEFETDLRCTQDGHIVLCHDANLARFSQHPSAQKPIAQLTLKQLQAIPLADGQSVLTLCDLLDEFCQYRWIFDIKPETASATIEALTQFWWPSKYKWFLAHQVRYLFWQKEHEAMLKERYQQASCMARLEQCRRAGISAAIGMPFLGAIQEGKTYALPPRAYGFNLYKKSIIKRYHKHDARVLAYLPENPAQLSAAIAAGVDEILSDQSPINGGTRMLQWPLNAAAHSEHK